MFTGLVDLWQTRPYGCHSSNTYNICLCWTTEFIQPLNNKTMGTFHSAERLSAQWEAVLSGSKRSVNEQSQSEHPQLSHIQCAHVGLSPIVLRRHGVRVCICWLVLNHWAHYKHQISQKEMNIFRTGEIKKNFFIADSCCLCLSASTGGLNVSFQFLCQRRAMVDGNKDVVCLCRLEDFWTEKRFGLMESTNLDDV